MYPDGEYVMEGMIEKAQLPLRVPGMVKVSEFILKALDQDRSRMMVRALRQYPDSGRADIIKKSARLASLERGEGVEFDSVLDEATATISPAS